MTIRRVSQGVGVLGIGVSVIWIFHDRTLGALSGLASSVMGFILTLLPAPPRHPTRSHWLPHREGVILVSIAGFIMLKLLFSNIVKLNIMQTLTSLETLILLCFIAVLFFTAFLLQLRAAIAMNTDKDRMSTSSPNDIVQPTAPPGEAILRCLSIRMVEGAHEVRLFRRTILRESDNMLEQRGSFPLLDLQIENIGGQSAKLQSLGLTVTQTKRTYQARRGLGTFFDVSWDFTLLLEPKEIGKRKQVDIPVTVLPNQTCRIVLAVGHQLGYGHYETVTYDIAFDLRYDGDRVIELGKERISVFCPWDFLPGEPSSPRTLYEPGQVR